jgi:hypothetical protein
MGRNFNSRFCEEKNPGGFSSGRSEGVAAVPVNRWFLATESIPARKSGAREFGPRLCGRDDECGGDTTLLATAGYRKHPFSRSAAWSAAVKESSYQLVAVNLRDFPLATGFFATPVRATRG